MNFAKQHIKDSEVFDVVTKLFDIVPDALKHGKVRNPWPNVDAVSFLYIIMVLKNFNSILFYLYV